MDFPQSDRERCLIGSRCVSSGPNARPCRLVVLANGAGAQELQRSSAQCIGDGELPLTVYTSREDDLSSVWRPIGGGPEVHLADRKQIGSALVDRGGKT